MNKLPKPGGVPDLDRLTALVAERIRPILGPHLCPTDEALRYMVQAELERRRRLPSLMPIEPCDLDERIAILTSFIETSKDRHQRSQRALDRLRIMVELPTTERSDEQ